MQKSIESDCNISAYEKWGHNTDGDALLITAKQKKKVIFGLSYFFFESVF